MWYSTADNNFHVFDGVTDRTLESYAQRLTINIIDALNSTSPTSALSEIRQFHYNQHMLNYQYMLW
jgi:hypothetical protein